MTGAYVVGISNVSCFVHPRRTRSRCSAGSPESSARASLPSVDQAVTVLIRPSRRRARNPSRFSPTRDRPVPLAIQILAEDPTDGFRRLLLHREHHPQHVTSDSYPRSCGRNSPGTPVFSTNRIPHSAPRPANRLRPGMAEPALNLGQPRLDQLPQLILDLLRPVLRHQQPHHKTRGIPGPRPPLRIRRTCGFRGFIRRNRLRPYAFRYRNVDCGLIGFDTTHNE